MNYRQNENEMVIYFEPDLIAMLTGSSFLVFNFCFLVTAA